MDATRSIISNELNFILKVLGERTGSGRYSESVEYFVSAVLQLLSSKLKEQNENHIMVGLYGSAAEDLKCIERDDLGDMDIMIFPNSDNLIIHEEMLEYSLENPLHVRIKGGDYPVLQSCLVEHTEYVATSALKNFHPEIFGWGLPLILEESTRYFQALSREEFPTFAYSLLKNSEASPAVTSNVIHLFQGHTNLPVEAIEFVAHMFCSIRGTDYTRQHAEIVDNLTLLLKETETTVDPIGECFRMFSLLAESSQSGTVKRNSVKKKSAYSNVGERTFKRELQPLGQIGELTHASRDLPSNPHGRGEKELRELQHERSLQHVYRRFVKHLIGMESETKEAQTLETEFKNIENAQLYEGFGSKSGTDIIPAFRSRGWPRIAREWIQRERKWPSPDIVKKVVQEGYHLVVKAPKKNGNPECDFRISFSHAEYLLSQEMNDIQRECYRCLKRYHRAYLSTQPKSLVSFHLKNIFLQTIEETGAEMWTESNRAECMMKLLGNLLEALERKDLRHFFVKSYNLFGDDYIENLEILESVAGKVEQIIQCPVRFSMALIQAKQDTVSRSQPTVPCDSCARQRHEEIACKTGYVTQGKKERATTPLLLTEATQEKGAAASYRYHDLKDTYQEVTKELVDMALNDVDCRPETMDPLKRSLVEDLRELGRKHNLAEPFEELFEVFDDFWEVWGYYRVWMSTEPDLRRRVLEAIQAAVEMLKHMRKKDDCTDFGNIFYRFFQDPSADLNQIVPSGFLTQLMHKFSDSLTRQARPYVVYDMLDDIPLD